MGYISEQLALGTTASLLAALILGILGWVTRKGAITNDERPVQNIGVNGDNLGYSHVDQSQTTLNVHTTTHFHNAPADSRSHNVAKVFWTVFACVYASAMIVGTFTAPFWQPVVSSLAPVNTVLTTTAFLLAAFGRSDLRRRHVRIGVVGVITAVLSSVAVQTLDRIGDVSRAVIKAATPEDQTDVITHLSPDKMAQLIGAGVVMGTLIMLTSVVTISIASAVAAGCIPQGMSADRPGAFMGPCRKPGVVILASVIVVALTAAGLWLVVSGYQVFPSAWASTPAVT